MQAGGTPLVHIGERKRTDSLIYDLACLVLSPFSYDVIGLENIQTSGPAIYTANHLGATGPLQTVLSVPIRFHPWTIAEMSDPERAPQYLYDDFVHPVLKLKGRLGLWFSTQLSKISIPLFNSIGVIPIDRFGGWTADGFRLSLHMLHEGKNLLIFPEDSLLPMDPETKMCHFKPGFATLAGMFQSQAGFQLPVYPVAVHAGAETVSIGKPEFFRVFGQHHKAADAFSELMEARVRELYMELKRTVDVIE